MSGIVNKSADIRKIAVVGAGYVGLVSSVCLSELGHEVICLDIDRERLTKLLSGEVDIAEPGIAEWMTRNAEAGRLSFTDDYRKAIPDVDFVLICVDTPVDAFAEPDLRNLRAAVYGVADYISDGACIVLRSTVPPGTSQLVSGWLGNSGNRSISIAVQPEFFQEGRALEDCWNPIRIVVGSEKEETALLVANLWKTREAPVVVTDLATAEMIKQASNAFLATKISFINDIAGICDAVGADIDKVAEGMGHDPRIGFSYLKAGIGFGGSCLPKDLRALLHTAASKGVAVQQLEATIAVNERQREIVLRILSEHLGNLTRSSIAILGLAFKPGTSDLRDSPAIALAESLALAGATVSATDPAISSEIALRVSGILKFSPDAYSAANGADGIVLATDWEEFKNLDWQRIADSMAGKIVVDGRNYLEASRIETAGLKYIGIGRNS